MAGTRIGGLSVAAVASLSLLGACTTIAPVTSQSTPQVSAQTTSATIKNDRLTPAQRKMREQANLVRQTTVEGVVIGAVVGAVAGGILGGRDGAVIGALVGGGLGGIAGNAIGDEQAKAAVKLDSIEALTKAVREKNVQVASSIKSMEEVMREDKKTYAFLKNGLKTKKITKEKYEQELQVIKADREEISQTLASLAKQVADYDANLADLKRNNPEQQTADAHAALDELARSRDHMQQLMGIADKAMPI